MLLHAFNKPKITRGLFSLLVFALFSGTVLIFTSCGRGKNASSVNNKKPNNPIPAITSLSPLKATAGTGSVSLTINGSGYISSSVVRWNGSSYAATYSSSNRLNVIIPAGAIASPGIAQIAVYNPAPGGGVSNTKDFRIFEYPKDWTFLGAPSINGTSDPDVFQIAVDAEDERILYVNARSGLFISRDGTASYVLAVTAKQPGSVGMIARDPGTVNRLCYGQANNFYISNDRGITWTLASSLNPGLHFISLAISGIYPNTIYAGVTGDGVTPSLFYRSDDNGRSWKTYSYGSAVSAAYPLNPWVAAEDPVDGTLYVGGEYSARSHPPDPFARSMNGGLTWNDVAPKDESGNTTMGIPVIVEIDPVTQKLYVLPEGNVVHTSTDHGTTWKRAQTWYLHGAFLRDPNHPGRFFGGVHYNGALALGGAFISTDDAEIFEPFGMEGFAVTSLALSGDSRTLFAASYQTGIFVRPAPDTGN